MFHNDNNSFSLKLIGISFVFAMFGLFSDFSGTGANAQVKKLQPKSANALTKSAGTQQPLYSDYKGVRIGMSHTEARAKLGPPTREFESQDLYVVSETETVQLFFDRSRNITAISIDYLSSTSAAPDYKTVVGNDVEIKPDGSIYKLVRYEQLGFWVSFSRTAGDLGITTITIQKIP
jgi:hypothetical protein